MPEGMPEDAFVDPGEGHAHSYTLIYLHGYTRTGEEYMPNSTLGFCMPWCPGGDRAEGLRVVLPTAKPLMQPWGECEPSWYTYAEWWHNRCGNPETLAATRKRLSDVVRREVARLQGDGRRVFLGGASQGCTVALDIYLRLASNLRLGGFVGSIGFLPSDSKGFPSSNRALNTLLKDGEQATRPVWIQCAVDDKHDVPWNSVVQPSLKRCGGRLHGLLLREVYGRGHHIEEWEAHVVNDFLRAHASEAYD